MRSPLRTTLLAALLAFSGILVAGVAGATSRVHPRVLQALDTLAPGATLPVWIVFVDKGMSEAAKAAPPATLVSERSLRRRLKVRSTAAAVDAADLPLDAGYVRDVAGRVTRVRQRSKWFNRVSVDATREEIAAVAALPCVASVEPLVRFRRAADPIEAEPDAKPGPAADDRSGQATLEGSPDRATDILDYGPSRIQLQQIGVTTLHQQGFTGAGVLIGHFDNGYRLLAHETFAATDIVAGWDFVDNDPDPAPPIGSAAGDGAHGIITLSTLAGYTPGQLVGAAFDASYVIARTEEFAQETPVEEDNWVAAIEWADSLGIDVASTSLGYLTYDLPFPSWTWEDMDGNTTVITRAADRAASLGIVVVNSAGNNGPNVSHNTLNGPADGDSVVAVGAVDSFGVRANFSSVGPTTDVPARIKPDVSAQGVSVRCARTASTTDYGTASGTSLSCPLVAGVAALLIQAHPAATAMQIVDAMRSTASQASSPDNLLGWGIVDAVAASAALVAADGVATPVPFGRHLELVPNPFNPSTSIRYALPEPALLRVEILDARGRLVRSLRAGLAPAGAGALAWDGRDARGHALPSGIYFCRLSATPESGSPWSMQEKAVLVR